MSEHDQRQYILMKQCIQGFESGNVNLRVLISSLKGLLDVLQSVRQEWKDAFSGEWWTLEEVYSFASDQEKAYLSQEDQKLVYEAIENMKQLLENVLEKKTEGNGIESEI